MIRAQQYRRTLSTPVRQQGSQSESQAQEMLVLSCELTVSDAVSDQPLLMTLGGFVFHANSVHEYDPDDFLRPLE